MLRQSKRPFLYAGGGVIASGAAPELLRFAETLQAPVCTSLMGLGGFPEDHPLSLGMIGMHGLLRRRHGPGPQRPDRGAGRQVLRPGGRGSGKTSEKQAKILQLDVDLAEVDKNVLVDRYRDRGSEGNP